MAKSNTGKALENFVSQIEGLFHSNNVKIKVNDKVIVDGVVFAEFDIIVSGNFGSTDIKWLIECRDRPSSGKQGASWVEQLHGRKSLHGFDIVTAVLTTGFSAPAINAAEKLGIEIRVVNNIEKEEVDWVPGIRANIVYHLTKVKEASVELRSLNSADASAAINKFISSADLSGYGVFVDGDPITFQDLFLNASNNDSQYDELYNSIEDNGEPLVVTITADFEEAGSCLLKINKDTYDIKRIIMKGTFSKIAVPQVFLDAYRYKVEGMASNIASQTKYSANVPDGVSFPISYTQVDDKDIFTISPPDSESK